MSDIFNHACDAFDRMENGEGEFFEYKEPWSEECRYCGKSSLSWIKTEKGWRLKEKGTGNLHYCEEYNNKERGKDLHE